MFHLFFVGNFRARFWSMKDHEAQSKTDAQGSHHEQGRKIFMSLHGKIVRGKKDKADHQETYAAFNSEFHNVSFLRSELICFKYLEQLIQFRREDDLCPAVLLARFGSFGRIDGEELTTACSGDALRIYGCAAQ